MKTRTVTIMLTGTAAVLIAGYIYVVSSLSSAGYSIEENEQRRAELEVRINDLTLELTRRRTPVYLEEQGAILGLTKSKQAIRYIDTRGSSIGRADR